MIQAMIYNKAKLAAQKTKPKKCKIRKSKLVDVTLQLKELFGLDIEF